MLFGHNSRVHSNYSCLVSRTLVKKTEVIVDVSFWGYLQCHFTVTLKHNALLSVLPHCFSAHMRMGSLRHNSEHTDTHFLLYLDTQNPHLI